MNVFGLDVSTYKIAVAKLTLDDFDVIEFQSKSRSWETRLKELYFQLFPYVQTNIVPDDMVCIEEIPLVQNRQSLIKLVHVLSMCRTIFMHFELDCFPVNVKTWKRVVVGDGNADKDKVTIMAKKIFGDRIKGLSQDSIDSLMVAKWGSLRLKSIG